MSETPSTEKASPRWRRWALEALIFAAGMLALHFWQTRHAPSGPAPRFAGQTVDHQPFDLADWRQSHPGKAQLIYFWADWCGVCKTTAGTVSNLGEDWPVITVAMQSGSADQVADTLRERMQDWPTIADPKADIFRKFGFQGVPAFVIIDPNGEIRATSIGYTSEIGLRLRLWWASQSHS